jgi:tetratricopeptide (TPR) repeat protein
LKNVLQANTPKRQVRLRWPLISILSITTTIMSNKAAAEAKAKGNAFFLKKQYPEAIEWYTKAIKADPNDSTFYSNRCAAYMGLDKFNDALKDAEMCIKLQPTWVKVRRPLVALSRTICSPTRCQFEIRGARSISIRLISGAIRAGTARALP